MLDPIYRILLEMVIVTLFILISINSLFLQYMERSRYFPEYDTSYTSAPKVCNAVGFLSDVH